METEHSDCSADVFCAATQDSANRMSCYKVLCICRHREVASLLGSDVDRYVTVSLVYFTLFERQVLILILLQFRHSKHDVT
jgi:hypothetical protein